MNTNMNHYANTGTIAPPPYKSDGIHTATATATATGTSSTSSCSSHHHNALLEIIQEKERDLHRIRQAADTAAQEDKTKTQQQIVQLRSHNEQSNLKIQSLQQQINDLEQTHAKALQRAERDCMDQAQDRIAKKTIQFEEEWRGRLKKEYREKLLHKEHQLEKEYQVAILQELRNQEVDLHAKLDAVMMEREQEHSRQVQDLQKAIQSKEVEISKLAHLNELDQHASEEHWKREVRAECEAELRLQLAQCERHHNSITLALEAEKEQMMKELQQVRQEKSKTEMDNQEVHWKIDELLGVLQNMESEYMTKVESLKVLKKKLKAKEEEVHRTISTTEASSRHIEEECNRSLKAMQKKCRNEKKTLSRIIKNLQKELEATREEKEDIVETIKEKENEAINSKRLLKEKLSGLKRECNSLRQEIETIHAKATSVRRNDSSRTDEMEEVLFEKERENTVARKRLLQQFDDTRKRDKETFLQEKLRLVRERDDIIIEKEAAVLELERKRSECDLLRAELSSLRQRKQIDFEASEGKYKELIAITDRVKNENHQLKESIRTMRSEMEKLMMPPVDKQPTNLPDAFKNVQMQSHNPSQINVTTQQEILRDHQANSLHAQEMLNAKVRNMETRVQELSADNKSMTIERDSLIDISNQLRAEVSRVQIHINGAQADQANGCIKHIMKSNQLDQSQKDEDIDVDDLAKNVWANAVQPSQPRKTPMRRRASQRATKSQEVILHKMSRGQGHSRNCGPLREKGHQIRNWNIKDDG